MHTLITKICRNLMRDIHQIDRWWDNVEESTVLSYIDYVFDEIHNISLNSSLCTLDTVNHNITVTIHYTITDDGDDIRYRFSMSDWIKIQRCSTLMDIRF